jgi:hypothetical protein
MFLDWSRPALPQLVDWLCDEYSIVGHVDLSDLVLVFQGRAASRRFMELLTERTGGRNEPPQTVTVGQLPELLYEPKRSFADDLTQRLAWSQALQSLSRNELGILTHRVPEEGDSDRWLALAELLARNHTELAADGLDFAAVAEKGTALPGFQEHQRWQVLRVVQERYLAQLDELDLWDRQTARLVAIRHEECRTDKQILLVAAVDMNHTLREMLDQVADRVTAVIHAPKSMKAKFDEHGCLIPEMWSDVQIDLDPSQVRVVDGPTDQAAEVAYTLAGYKGAFSARDIAVGIPDERLVPYIRRQLGDCGLRTRSIVERPLPQTLPFTFLKAAADYLDDPRVHRFAALVRHPDIAAWLEAQQASAGWLTELDCYIADHLQPRLGEWLGREKHCRGVRKAHELVEALLAPLRKPPAPLASWSDGVVDVLLTLYGHVEFDENHATHRVALEACRFITEQLREQTKVPDSLSPTVAAAHAIRLALEEVEQEVIPPLPDPGAIELMGWLELPLDDAPAAIVTSFNEGHVPTSVNSDLFLPNGLRKQLGVLDNSRRYARDAYALSALLHSRQSVTLIVGRRDIDGNLLKPSRLLFAAKPEAIANRVRQFYSEATSATPRPRLQSGLAASRETAAFTIPRPLPLGNTVVKVTAFKDYIRCPYRYYLRHIHRLEGLNDAADELDGAAFGNLLHNVLADFGLSDVKDSADEGEITAWLKERMKRRVRELYGKALRPSVRIQLEQIARRLQAFATWQAHHASLGHRIRHVEQPGHNEPIPFPVGGGRFIHLKGRIDRIDQDADGKWLILDYKTGAKVETPEKTHQRGKPGEKEWVDLQLPLYRHLARPMGVDGNVKVGYVLLPEDSRSTSLVLAEWQGVDYADADDLAREIGRKLLDGVFWPPRHESDLDYPPAEFIPICHDGTFDRENLPGANA